LKFPTELVNETVSTRATENDAAIVKDSCTKGYDIIRQRRPCFREGFFSDRTAEFKFESHRGAFLNGVQQFEGNIDDLRTDSFTREDTDQEWIT
jgi:hypothetical protein